MKGKVEKDIIELRIATKNDSREGSVFNAQSLKNRIKERNRK